MRAWVVGCCFVLVVAMAACGDDDGGAEGEAACEVVSADALAVAAGASEVEATAFEHEETGDGTWCLYTVDGLRLELQVQGGGRAAFVERHASAERDGAGFAEIAGVGDAAFRDTAGIPALVALVGDDVIVVQILDLEVPDATAEALLRLAVDSLA